MGRLMIGISGVRGVVGEDLTPQLLVNLGQAFGTWAGSGRAVVVGRDTRASGDMARHAVLAGLLASGCRVLDVGVCATPTAAMAIPELQADGGIVISASHNTIEWNALKFFRRDGIYLNQKQSRELLDIYYGGDAVRVTHDHLRALETIENVEDYHLRRVLACVDVPALRKRRFRVALDACNGAGSRLAINFLNEIGADIAPLWCDMDGRFPRNPEPTAGHVVRLIDVVREHGSDVGFAQDADADRLALVSEQPRYIGEEYTLCLAARHVLSHTPGPVVANLSTTRMIEDVAAKFGAAVHRTPVGEVNVAEEILARGAVVGGEGNGGVIDPRVHCGRDALTGMAHILMLMLETGRTLSSLAAEIPAYHMYKGKVPCPRRSAEKALEALAHEPADRVDTRDGVKLDFADGWVHVRQSNTEPIVRVYTEARTVEAAQALGEKYQRLIEAVVKAS